MAHLYECAVTKTTGAAAGPIATLVSAASPRAEIREIGVFLTTAVAAEVGTGRPAAAGVGTLTGNLIQALDSADVAGVHTLTTAFGTSAPTAPAVPMKRIQLPAVIGAGVVWVYAPGELIVPISANFVVWQFSAAAVGFDVYMKVVQ
jgi:hypothetical protein